MHNIGKHMNYKYLFLFQMCFFQGVPVECSLSSECHHVPQDVPNSTNFFIPYTRHLKVSPFYLYRWAKGDFWHSLGLNISFSFGWASEALVFILWSWMAHSQKRKRKKRLELGRHAPSNKYKDEYVLYK
jgi:hypothetical protein